MEYRKVLFQEYPYEFDPETEVTEQSMQQQNGLFHRWIEVEEHSIQSDKFINVTKALIEKDNGLLVAVNYELVQFVD